MADSHATAIARKVAVQLAEAVGFDTAQESAVEVLSGIINRYIAQLCRASHDLAELGGRTKLNVVDLLLVMEEMNVDLDELDKYVTSQEEVPFATSVLAFPIHRQSRGEPSFASKMAPHPAHIPAFLPAFPEAHTWTETPVYQGRATDVKTAREAAAWRRLEGEQALLQLNRRMRLDEARDAAGSNPFLLTPELLQPQPQLQLQGAPGGAEGGPLQEGAAAGQQLQVAGAQSPQKGGGRAAGMARLQLDAASKALEPVVKGWAQLEAEGPGEERGVAWREAAPTAADDPLLPQPAVLFQAHWAANMRARVAGFSAQKLVADAFRGEGGGPKLASSKRRKSHHGRLDPDAATARAMLEGGAEELNVDD